MNYFKITSILLFFATAKSYAQNDFHYHLEPVFDFTKLYTRLEEKNHSAYIPEDIYQQQYDRFLGRADIGRNYTDIPQMHNSALFGGCTTIDYQNKFKVYFDLFAEQRGMSYGVLTKEYFLVYPKIRFSFSDSLKIKNQKIQLEVSLGDTSNYKQNEGLFINRVDVHHQKIKLDYKNLSFEFNKIGDLSNSPGLGITEFYSPSIHYTKNRFNICTSLDFYNSSDGKTLKKSKKESLHTISGRYQWDKSALYFEYATVLASDIVKTSYLSKSAFLVGHDIKIAKKDKIDIRLSNKFRFFQKDFFNSKKGGRVLIYRDDFSTRTTLHGNYKGAALYPLINNNLGFDQWSVYRDYDNQQLYSLATELKCKWYFYHKIGLFLDLETNIIRTNQNNQANYIFYNSGLLYNIGNEIFIKLYLTNKVMNLDYEYQTFYQAKLPLLGISIQRLVGRYKYD